MKITVAFALVLMVLAGCRKAQEPTEPPAPKVDGETVTFPDKAPQLSYLSVETAAPSETLEVSLYGRLAWDEDHTARIYSPVAGRVVRIQADVGQKVLTGDALASLASPDYGQAQADVKKAASDLALADRTLSRERELYAHGAAAQKDVDSAQADFEKASAEHQRAVAQLQALVHDGTDAGDGLYPLQSPVAGVVAEKNITPGQQVRPDTQLANAPQLFAPLFVVSDPHKLWLFLDVTELDAVTLKPGQEIHVHTKAYPGRVFVGQLERLGDSLDPTTRTIKARAVLDNPDNLLKAEMYVTAEVVSDGVQGVDVSAKAVFLKNNQFYAFIERTPGQFERRAVKLGPENAGKITVTDGIAAGQRVVTDGCLLLQSLLENGANS
jgi:cobalt-zinc-cadmium efflux system membrane fusion protein